MPQGIRSAEALDSDASLLGTPTSTFMTACRLLHAAKHNGFFRIAKATPIRVASSFVSLL